MSKLICILLLLALAGGGPVAAQNPLDEVVREIEERNMQRLRAQQQRPGVTLGSFQSDGCSGGLSDAWQLVAGTWPEFSRAFGDQPPWEHCCVAHDRDYWRGDSVDGFEKRLQADRALRQCVVDTGRQQAGVIAQRIGLARDEVLRAFDLAANLMYGAVRMGGAPCTGLAWRWGYGWPHCDADTEPLPDDLINARLAKPPCEAFGSGRCSAQWSGEMSRGILATTRSPPSPDFAKLSSPW